MLELKALGLVNRHDLHGVSPRRRSLGVIRGARQHSVQRNRQVDEQRFASMEALVHRFDAFESFDRSTEIGHRLDSLLGRQLKLEQPAQSAVFDEGGVGERREWQAGRAFEEAVPGGHGVM